MEGPKKLVARLSLTAAALGTSLLFAPAVFAATAENSNTGADSTNDASVDITNDVDISSNNSANIRNSIYVNANTGGNSASQNTGDGSVSTGDINGSARIRNNVNSNSLNRVDFDCSGVCIVSADISASNSHTGADSSNDANVNVNNDIDITQNNDLDIDNKVDADLDTGNNEADENTGDGSVKTGDINFDVTIDNQGNNNTIGGPADKEPEGQPPTPPAPVTPPAKGPEKGRVLAATKGLPVTGGNHPFLPALALVLAGLVMKRLEEMLSLRFLKED